MKYLMKFLVIGTASHGASIPIFAFGISGPALASFTGSLTGERRECFSRKDSSFIRYAAEITGRASSGVLIHSLVRIRRFGEAVLRSASALKAHVRKRRAKRMDNIVIARYFDIMFTLPFPGIFNPVNHQSYYIMDFDA